MIGQAIAGHHPLPEGAAEKFDRFHALLSDWNARMDLTAVSGTDALTRHYLDALTARTLLPAGAAVIDVGTGAGFPGVPLALARPDIRMTLLDAQRKRIDFLQQAIGDVPFDATAVHGRAEDYAKTHRESFDIAVSRAVASLPVLLEWLLPLVKVGGQCILWKGPGVDAEWPDARRVVPMLGGGAPEKMAVQIPGEDWQHTLVIVRKTAPTPNTFPRKAGMATKRPL